MTDSIFKDPQTMFETITVKEVTEYLIKWGVNSKDEDRRKNIAIVLKDIAEGRAKPLFGFKNEYGEKYLVVQDTADKAHWCGDESDWEYASSFYEDKFMHQEVEKLNL